MGSPGSQTLWGKLVFDSRDPDKNAFSLPSSLSPSLSLLIQLINLTNTKRVDI